MMRQVVRRGRSTAVAVVAIFVLASAASFLYIYGHAGGSYPWTSHVYTVSFRTTDTKNLVTDGGVRIAGVVVGSVLSVVQEGDHAKVELELNPEAVPLHDGVRVRIGMKSLLGQSYLNVVDGAGASLPSGATLRDAAVVPAVDVDELLQTFDPKTQAALTQTLRGLGNATSGRQEDVDTILAGLGPIGTNGRVAVNALVAQNESLTQLTAEMNSILNAFDTADGAIADVITSAQRIAAATSRQAPALRSTLRQMPSLLANATSATHSVRGLSSDLAPVATNLRVAAPDLTEALRQLPQTTSALSGLLPALDTTLDRAPATLKGIPPVADQLGSLMPQLGSVLLDLAPMVDYAKPYGTDIGSFLGNFGATFDRSMENGVRPVSLAPIFNEYSVRNSPLRFAELDPLHWLNPYPAPLTADQPSKWTGKYPHVERLQQ